MLPRSASQSTGLYRIASFGVVTSNPADCPAEAKEALMSNSV